MRAPNHIAGGIVFTGIFCSFWNINIFSNPWYLSLTVFSSLLPDIDHSRSIIGKMFLPISRYLDRNFGHRTITHSIIFALATYLLVYLISAFSLKDMNFPMIFIFALSSHLIFDMLTVQGVPLFYPFKRNPCVIPGNPDLRLNSKLGTETIIFSVFIIMLYFCMPLFENGFWLSYHRNYNSLKHLHQTAQKLDKVLEVEYSFNDHSDQKTGKAYLLNSTNTKAILYDQDKIIVIENTARITKLTPQKTDLIKEFQTLSFQNINADSLNNLLNNIVVSANITSSAAFNATVNNNITTGTNLKLEWTMNAFISELPNPENEKIRMKEIELNHQKKLLALEQKYYYNLLQKRSEIQAKFKTDISDYTRELLTVHLKDLEKEIANFEVDDLKVHKLKEELDLLIEKSAITQNYSGEINILTITKPAP